MSEINPAALGADIASSAASGTRPRGYQDAREVERRAAVAQGDDNPRNRAALLRLNRLLSSGRPLDENVPRGYYLNIQV